MPDGLVVAIIVLVVGSVLAAAFLIFEHRRHRRADAKVQHRPAERLPLFGTDRLATRGTDGALHVDDADDTGDGAPRRHVVPPVRRVPTVADFPPVAPAPMARPGVTADDLSSFAPDPWAPATARTTGRSGSHEPAHAGAFARSAPGVAPVASPGFADAAFANGETLRFALPDEGTLRFLPGRLEVVAGPDSGREIRFVAPQGAGDAVEITFGRTEGPAYRHVQLLARTVSRQHALMLLSDDHWSLKNLSATNPVVLNGRPLAPDELAPLLVDGDRIEMGEVTFTFHSR
jgi:hypothetical protein